MQSLIEVLRRLWLLVLALFPAFSRERRPSKTVLPVSVKAKTKLVGKPEPISYRINGSLGQGRSEASQTQLFRHPGLFTRQNHRRYGQNFEEPNALHGRFANSSAPRFALMSSDPNKPPRRPPRPPFTSLCSSGGSEDDFSTVSDVHLPSVIVTPCTPSTEENKTDTETIGGKEPEHESDESSYSGSALSNPFLESLSSTGHKVVESSPYELLSHHNRARSLTGTGMGLKRGLQKRPSQVVELSRTHRHLPPVSPQPVMDVPNPVERSNSSPSVGVTPRNFVASYIFHPRPNIIWDAGPVPGQRIYPYTTNTPLAKKPKGASEPKPAPGVKPETMLVNAGDPKTQVSGDEGKMAPLAYKYSIQSQTFTPSHSVSSVKEERLDLLPYPDVFDINLYYGPPLIRQESTQSQTSSNTISSDTSNSVSSPIPTSPSEPSLTSMESSPRPRPRLRPLNNLPSGLLPKFIPNDPNKLTMDREVKRYRDHYRHPAYSRPPAFAVESITTNKKFIKLSNTESSSDSSISLQYQRGITTMSKVLPLPVPMSSNSSRTRERLLEERKPFQIGRARSNPALRPKQMFKVANPTLKPTRITRSATSTHIFNAAVPAPIKRPLYPQLSSKVERPQMVQTKETSLASCKGRFRSKSISNHRPAPIS